MLAAQMGQATGMSSSLDDVALVEGTGAGQAEPSTYLEPSRNAVEIQIGVNGLGLYLAHPVNRHVTLRLGGNFTTFSGSFVEEGETIDGSLRFAYGRAAVDLYPNGGNGRFHISPQIIFGNNTRAHASVVVNATDELDFNGDTYTSDPTDPLRGAGQVDFRKTVPALTVGWGNRTHGFGHWMFPVEVGAMYVGHPRLTVDFRGSACDVTHPANGCGDISQDADFQKDLAAFIARQNRNLNYAQFLPIVNFGVGYRF